MNLWLMRHCEPTPGDRMNAERGLYPVGVQEASGMATWMRGHIGRVDIVISSPFARAIQTADPMAKALGSYVVTTTLLEPDGKPEDIWKEIERIAMMSKDVLIVGHHPSLMTLILWLIQDADEDGQINMAHGAIAHVKESALHYVVTPQIVIPDMEIVEAARDLAKSIKEAAKPAPTKKKIAVAAFASVLPTGKLADPQDIGEGDTLYRQRNSEPAAGTVSLFENGMQFATALEALAAGDESKIDVEMHQKQWVTDADPCEDCEDNADEGWIDADDEFPSGDDEPPAHPNCHCSLDVREGDDT
jgi:phosphohistidine phosphatase SixA